MIVENINQFSFNGKRSFDDMGLIITEAPVSSAPERDMDFISIPGRSGDIISDNERYKNITVSYKVTAIAEDFNIELMLRKLKAWIAGSVGYYKLSDTYDPNYYRLAAVGGAIEFEQKMRAIGAGTLKFNCKPFKYSIDGQRFISIAAAATLYNREDWESTPYIKIVGSGDVTLMINNASFVFTGINEYIEVDGEIMAAYKGTTLQNSKISFSKFPKLAPGPNNISFTGTVTEIQIAPRWCAL